MKKRHLPWLKGIRYFKSNHLRSLAPFLALSIAMIGCQQTTSPLSGSWKPRKYVLASGESKPVDGHIFFSEDQWSVVFFILDENGEPLSASAEGGTYELRGDNLTFSHYYNLSDVDKGVSSALNKIIRTEASEVPRETCTIEIEDDLLAIYFPSGNAMIFSRS